MKPLDDYTTSLVMDYLVNRIQEEKGVKTKKLAKLLLLNALSYNIVIGEILNQIDYLLEE